jgi:hypothetical protein
MKCLAVALTLVAAASAGCGDGDDDGTARTSAVESETSTDPIVRKERIVIKTYADLASVVDTGKVLDGSSLGDSSFCSKGTFSGGHGNTENGWLDHTFECPDGTLRIAFDPRTMTKRSASGPWRVLSGTGAYRGMEGSGEMEIKFPADPQLMEGHETFTGTVSQRQ